ncbi:MULTISPECIES: metal ABC transporter ATP-binding protein [Gordonia]|jgi:manganese transport system ATP-binding protein|uniref:metal ABC transporter ATP-binding protein n=1 Tax=Gordonia TaxID=2053 RepID=UPI00095DE49C|nr:MULTISPECIES: metal ABC transporter ATP-binding protein [Gordonia]MDH3009276.1 metal ABC transporter ATP-binding protein [Gordonia alkanivorans]MDH3010608.1 metal ABC transporter ATP-binding protein [Gordonia alkanivorans]MDH3020068.1 metal ABC transporter ATP-binding protein [Gordonia alkanivorans]MDH3023632.1 metal ABC transporter ATP-binding protein [Gordonia alkanivorans]MDH3043560.1 metal ABC transporter ATP-binding protein [Gordonia alkanivorans]
MITSHAIEVDDVTVRYGRILALDHASVRVPTGRVCALVGMNGSGKSTLFKTIVGSVTPTTGSVTLAGKNPTAARKSGLVGYVPQSEVIDWSFPLSVRDVVMTGRYGHLGFTRRPKRADHDAVDEALARVELTEYADRQIGQLSGGQRKRAFVARGIAQEASILLLDEPFAGVDKRTEATITALLRELADSGVTILVSTHDLAVLPTLADEAILLMRRVVAQGDPTEVITTDNLIRAFGLDPLDRTEQTPRDRQEEAS